MTGLTTLTVSGGQTNVRTDGQKIPNDCSNLPPSWRGLTSYSATNKNGGEGGDMNEPTKLVQVIQMRSHTCTPNTNIYVHPHAHMHTHSYKHILNTMCIHSHIHSGQ